MNFKKINKKKGIAGLDVFLSIIVSLFLIGLVVMIFVIAGTKLETEAQTTASLSGFQEAYNASDTGYTITLTDCNGYRNGVVTAVTNVTLSLDGSQEINAGNYSTSGCVFTELNNITANIYYNHTWNISYNFNYASNADALDVINVTKTSLSSATDWFDIFIVLGALVVLILLVVIIVTAVRGRGMLGGSGAPKQGA